MKHTKLIHYTTSQHNNNYNNNYTRPLRWSISSSITSVTLRTSKASGTSIFFRAARAVSRTTEI